MRHQRTLRYVDAIARVGSIRGAAEELAITPSALNRRLLALEDEIGAALFERRARGVRLSAAGELFVHHARRQMAEMARVHASIEDMKGARRGHVAIALDRSLCPRPFSRAIGRYRASYPGVTFEVRHCDRGDACALLESYAVDLVVAVEPERTGGFATLATVEMAFHALVAPEHALSRSAPIRLHDMLAHPLALPPAGSSARFLLDVAAARQDHRVTPAVSGPGELILPLVFAGEVIGVQLAFANGRFEEAPVDIGGRLDGSSGEREAMTERLVAVPLHAADVPPAYLHVGQLRGRTLPVPAARFAEVISRDIARLIGEA